MQTKELLAEVDSLKAEIDKLRPLKPEVEHRIMQKFRLDWNYHSNAIEGNQLTLGETRAFLMEGLTANGKPLKDHLDIKGHNELIDFLQLYIQQKQELAEAHIREMHKILLREPYETEAVTLDGRVVKKRVELGVYKTTPNFVRTGNNQVHQYVSPDDVGPMMDKLIQWQRSEEARKDLHPVIQASLLHHKFLAIHPFDDGNGRLGRILMNLLLMKHGFPPVVVKLSQRDRYVAGLRQADVGETGSLISFIGECLLDSERLYLRGANGESIEDADDVDKQVALLKQELQNVPKPMQLTWSIQERIVREKLAPLLNRLAKKLGQFDDLFATQWVRFNHSGQTGDSGTERVNWTNVVEKLLELLNRRRGVGQTSLLRTFEFTVVWEGFQKDGPNAFGATVFFRVHFDEWQYRVECPDLRFNEHLVYQEWLSEDKQKLLISEMAKLVLTQIQGRRRTTN